MFWYICLGVTGLLSIAGTVLWIVGNKYLWTSNMNVVGIFMTFIGGLSLIILTLACTIIPIQCKEEVATFIRQKDYFENVVPTLPDADNYALTQKRIELNEWLYKAQHQKTCYSIFSFYEDKVLELTEIR